MFGKPRSLGHHHRRCWHNAGSTARRMGVLQSGLVQCQLGPCPFDVQAMATPGPVASPTSAWCAALISEWAFRAPWTTNPTSPFIPPNFTWNLFVVAHELGHNFGSNHTHWCGWPGGPDHPDEPAGSNGTIHDCYETEGGCVEPVINEQGTIMSYCHLQPAGAILEFHPVVEQAALFPTINANGFCHRNCAAIETSCGSYGCTDPSACITTQTPFKTMGLAG